MLQTLLGSIKDALSSIKDSRAFQWVFEHKQLLMRIAIILFCGYIAFRIVMKLFPFLVLLLAIYGLGKLLGAK